jgi:putative membrane protein
LWLVVAGLAFSPYAVAQEKHDTGKGDAARSDTGKGDASRSGKADGKGQLSSADAKKLEAIARADMAEVAAGKVGVSKAQSAEVKKFAQHMVDEHSKMVDEGGKLAKSKGVEPPSGPDRKHQDALKKLEGLSGDKFDREFMAQMVKDHNDALKLVKETAKDAKDSDLKAMAQKAAPKVEEHLKMAQQISGKPGKGKSEAKATGGQMASSDATERPAARSSQK